MRWLRRKGGDPRNVLMDAALEFGPNWRRPIGELAAERCPSLSETDRMALCGEIEMARTFIEDSVAVRWRAVGCKWSGEDTAAARAWVVRRYRWMSKRNVERSVNQATYYAWHG